MKKILLAGVAALFVVPALAADLPTRKAPAPEPLPTEYNWTGIYFGGNLGWDWGHTSYNSYVYGVPPRPRLTTTGCSRTAAATAAASSSAAAKSAIDTCSRSGSCSAPKPAWTGIPAARPRSATSRARTSTSPAQPAWAARSSASPATPWGDFLPYIKGGWAWDNATVTRTQLFGKTGASGAFADQPDDLRGHDPQPQRLDHWRRPLLSLLEQLGSVRPVHVHQVQHGERELPSIRSGRARIR